jgi:hypothetical protein
VTAGLLKLHAGGVAPAVARQAAAQADPIFVLFDMCAQWSMSPPGAFVARFARVVVEVIAGLANVGQGVLKRSNFPGGTRWMPRRDAPEESGQGRLKKAFPCGACDE